MNHCSRFFVLLLVLLLVNALVSGQPSPKHEFRGCWVASVVNLDWPLSRSLSVDQQKNALIGMFDQLHAIGINAVIFQVRPECDALYKSDIEPWSYWLTGKQGTGPAPEYDPLQFAIEEAHKRGMELHAWFNPYRAERHIGSYPLDSQHVVVAHPDWILTFPAVTLKILDPGVPMVRDHVARVVADIVRRYDVDGVHADDYFYPYPDGSFPGITSEDDSTFAHYNRGFTDRGNWRRDNVNLLMKQIADSVAAIKPSAKFGLSPFGIWRPNYPPGISGLDAYNKIYADAMAWLQQHSIDYLTPQLYWPIGGSQDFAALMRWWADSTAAHGRHLYPGHIFGSYTPSELPNQVRLTRSDPDVGGSVFFRAQFFLNNTLGFADSLRADLYQIPALLPAMAWKEQIPPNAAANLSSSGPAGSVTLHWDPPAPATDGDTAARYAVYRVTRAAVTPEDLADARNLIAVSGVASATPGARVDSAGVQYFYAVTAVDRNSNESTPTSTVTISAPVANVQLSLPVDGEQHFHRGGAMSWKPSSGALAYMGEVSTAADFPRDSILARFTTTDTQAVVTTFSAQRTYFWRVVAGNQGGTTPYSETRSFITGWPRAPVLIVPVNVSNVPRYPVFSWTSAGGTSFHLVVTDYATNVAVLDTTVADTVVTSSRQLSTGKIYTWQVTATNPYGAGDPSVQARFRITATDVALLSDVIPTSFMLEQNFPNPFNPSTLIQYAIPRAAHVELKIYDMLGREVEKLVDEEQGPGYYRVTWSGERYASGVYVYRIVAGQYVAARRLLLLK